MRLLLVAAMCAALGPLGGCASSQQMQLDAIANQPVTVNAPKARAKDAVAAIFTQRGYRITKDTDFVLDFSVPTGSALAALLLSSRYSSEVDARVEVQFVGDNPTTVTWHAYLVTNPGSAFEQLTDVTKGTDAPAIQADIEGALSPLNGKPPAPTKTTATVSSVQATTGGGGVTGL